MKFPRTVFILSAISIIFMAISLVSCSSKQNPADQQLAAINTIRNAFMVAPVFGAAI